MENNKKSLLPIIAVFIITAIVASIIVWFILNQNKNTDINSPGGENKTEEISATPVTEAPTPTPIEISKDIKIQVLNATDINGQAATLKAELVKLGFTSVATGNSKESATKNEIQIKKTLAPDYFLQNLTEFASATTSELVSTSTYDVVFIIGVDLKTGSSVSSPSASPTLIP